MRVLLTTESSLPYVSGVTVSVDALARGLGAIGHDVVVLAPEPMRGERPAPVGSPGPEPAYGWLPSYQLPAIAPVGYRLPWPPVGSAAVRAALAFRPDVVHAHSPFVSGLVARSIARRLEVPLVFTHHTRFADYGHYLGPLAGMAARLADAHLRRFWAACAAVIAPSTDLAAEIRARVGVPGDVRVEVIPTGVDVDGIARLVPADVRVAAGWPPDALVVASLGRLAPEKSPAVVLEAVARAATRIPRLRLLVIGGGPSEAGLRARAKRADLRGRIHLTGPLARPEAHAHLRGADLFVFASRTETQGLVLAEAIAAGLPAIAVDGPGVRDSVRDGVDGIVVPAEPEAGLVARLADALVAVGAEPVRAAMAERARADAGRFDVGRRVRQVDNLYASLIGR